MPVPKKVCVAVSAGVDSMAMLDFLQKSYREITALFFNHGTQTSDHAEEFLKDYCYKKSLNLVVGKISCVDKPKEKSMEEYWRDERYKFLESFSEQTVVTAHHLGDQVENWIFTSLNGNPRLIPLVRNNVIRPILSTPKSQLTSWCERKGVPWCEDASNNDPKFMRNLIRHELLPVALKVNPGLEKVVKKMVLKMIKSGEDSA